MRKIILFMSMSVDGFFEGPGRDIGWHLVDDELRTHGGRAPSRRRLAATVS